MSALGRLAERAKDDQSGFTLVEMLVAMVLSAIVGGVLISLMIGAQRSATVTTSQNDINAEARDVLNRLSRDLRQAMPLVNAGVKIPAVTAVQNPGPGAATNAVTSLTFNADFDGDGCVAGVPSDGCNPPPAVDPSGNNPETETFCWDPTVQSVYLIAGGVNAGSCTPTSGTTPQPMLSGKVTSFQLSFYSNKYLYDANNDGVTTWQELDQAGLPIGNGNGTLDTTELVNINSVLIQVTVSDGHGHSQTYQTQTDLRNVS
jgi:prepilin-type N-terminal cleavage/methylation domain-containing protein